MFFGEFRRHMVLYDMERKWYNGLSAEILDCIEVHRIMGPGLLESVYPMPGKGITDRHFLSEGVYVLLKYKGWGS